MLSFDLSTYYSLLDVFDRTGRLMFPKDWTGEEAWARDSENPEPIKERRKQLFAEVTALQREMAPLNDLMGMDLSASEFQETSDSLGPLNDRLKEAKAELAQLPHVSDTWVSDHAAFSRRVSIEKELAQAFISGDLKIVVGAHRVVPWKDWCQRSDFRVYYALSMVRIPRGESAQRRGPAFIIRKEFDQWSERFVAETDAPVDLTPEAKCKEWLRAEVRGATGKAKVVAEYQEEAQAMFQGLSERAFLRIWAETVPDNWRKPGSRQGS